MPTATPLADQFRDAIDASGMSRYAICKATGIDPASLSRVMNRKQAVHERTLNKVGKLLGLEIVARTSGEVDRKTDRKTPALTAHRRSRTQGGRRKSSDF